MTITLDPPPRTTSRTAAPNPAPDRADTTGPALLAVLRGVVTASTDLDPDLFHSTGPAGRAVLTIAAAGRQHAEELGVDAGAPLSVAPGIVVMREAVRVLALLERTTDPIDGTGDSTLSPALADAYRTFLHHVGQLP